MFDTLIHQWKTGGNAELRFLCEKGFLRVNFGADLGPWRPATGEILPKYGDCVKPLSPSRLRRKERRAAERVSSAAAEVDAAEKTDAEATAPGKAAEDAAAAVKVAGKVLTAEKAVDELVAAENAAHGIAVENTATEVTVVEKAADEESSGSRGSDAAEKVEDNATVVKGASEVASTSSCGKEQQTAETCWNCDQEMTFDHQCEVPSVTVRSRPSPSPFKCPPRTRRHGVSPPILERVKCHVCACLGRETSMVIVGSTCPSCGVTANSSTS